MKSGLMAIFIFAILLFSLAEISAQNLEQETRSISTQQEIDCLKIKEEMGKISPLATLIYDESVKPCRIASLQINYGDNSGTISNIPPRNTALTLPKGVSVKYNALEDVLIIQLINNGKVKYGQWEKDMKSGDYVSFYKDKTDLTRANIAPLGQSWLSWWGNYWDSRSLRKENIFDKIEYYDPAQNIQTAQNIPENPNIQTTPPVQTISPQQACIAGCKDNFCRMDCVERFSN